MKSFQAVISAALSPSKTKSNASLRIVELDDVCDWLELSMTELDSLLLDDSLTLRDESELSSGDSSFGRTNRRRC